MIEGNTFNVRDVPRLSQHVHAIKLEIVCRMRYS